MAHNQIHDESKLSVVLLQKRVLTEGQLKAALDYQRSLGGQLCDVLVKLNLLRSGQVEALLERLESPETLDGAEKAQGAEGPGPGSGDVLSPESVDVGELKVHKKLLEKVPREIVDRYLLLFFFPTPGVSQRRIILGHGREMPQDLLEKVQSLLGVQLCSLQMEPETAERILREHGHALAQQGSSPATPQSRDASPEAQASQEGRQSPQRRESHEGRETTEARESHEGHEEHEAHGGHESPDGQERQQGHQRRQGREHPQGHELHEGPQRQDQVRPSASAAAAPPSAQGPGVERSPQVRERTAEDEAAPTRERPERQRAQGSAGVPGRAEALLSALVGLLAKKGLISREELEVEIELGRIRQKAVTQGPQ